MRAVLRPSRQFFFAIGLCVGLAGCMDQGFWRSNAEVPSATDAETWYHNGDFGRAGQAFMDLADADREYRDHYRLRAAEAYREEGNLNAVAWALEGVEARHLSPPESTRVDLLEAEVALSHHDAARALNLLTLPEASLSPPLRQRTLELRARAQAASGDAFGSARTRAALDPLLKASDRAQNEARILDTLAPLDAQMLKDQAAALPPNDALRPFIDQVLRKSGQTLPQAVQNPGEPVGTFALGQNANSGEGYRAAHIVALLLPVEGQLKAVAQPIRDGFFAAYFSDAHLPRPEVRVYDSGNTPADAVAAYQRALGDGADHVVGPLLRDAVSAVFAQASLPVPVLALNQPEHGEAPPPGSAAYGLVPDTEAVQGANHMLERGITQAAIITASDDWAERAATAFRAQFESRHGVVLGEARLRDSDVNFSTMIHQALGTLPAGAATTPLPGAAPLPADAKVPGDAGIFISMRPQQARLLLPQLKLAGYSGTPVFATSHVFAGNLNPGMDRDLDGVEFCDAPWLFDAVVGLPRYSDIAGSLESARGPGARLFAMGMDAYALVPYLDWLEQHHDSYQPGATGQLTIDGLGRVQRLMIWARFTDGVAHPLNGGLQMSSVPAQ
ncbi:penicillin-binding protein activator [Rudaea sp.]|uniref:penicillin-binding protein activator n=1 Tax=Rudaea sp. TaxID=2136325 RepID=UPI002F95BF04